MQQRLSWFAAFREPVRLYIYEFKNVQNIRRLNNAPPQLEWTITLLLRRKALNSVVNCNCNAVEWCVAAARKVF